MSRNRKVLVIVGALALLAGLVTLRLTWPEDTARADCTKVPDGSVEQAPELNCAGFSKRPSSEAFGWLDDAQQPQAEIWGDDKGRKVAVSDVNDGADDENGNGNEWANRYIGVWVSDPNVWCSLDGNKFMNDLQALLVKAEAVQRTVADGSATIAEDGRITSETKLWCFVQRQLD